jgi:hypothetical protein
MEKFSIRKIARLPNESFGKISGEVKVDTAIIVIESGKPSMVEIVAYKGYNRIISIDSEKADTHIFADQNDWMKNSDSIWSITGSKSIETFLSKIESNSIPLEECCDFSLGITPYDKYKGHTQSQIENKVFHSDFKKDKTYKKLLAGNDVKRYPVKWNGKLWISYGPWLGAPRDSRFFTSKRILIKQIIDWTTKRIWAALTSEELYNSQNAFNLIANSKYTAEFILGVINSRLISFYHQKKFLDEYKMRFQKILIKDAKRFPIKKINFENFQEETEYEKLISFVIKMGKLVIDNPRTPQEKEALQRQIAATDKQIDNLVYQLYGLTPKRSRLWKALKVIARSA